MCEPSPGLSMADFVTALGKQSGSKGNLRGACQLLRSGLSDLGAKTEPGERGEADQPSKLFGTPAKGEQRTALMPCVLRDAPSGAPQHEVCHC